MKHRRWLWALAALPLVGVPLIAQQVPPVESSAPAPAPAPASAPAPEEAPPPEDTPEPVSREAAQPADERLSVDNSLSFPVDI